MALLSARTEIKEDKEAARLAAAKREALELLKKLKEDYPAIEREIENPDDAPLDGGTF